MDFWYSWWCFQNKILRNVHVVNWRTVLKTSTFFILGSFVSSWHWRWAYTCWENIEFLCRDVLLGSCLRGLILLEWMNWNSLCGCESYWSGSKSYVALSFSLQVLLSESVWLWQTVVWLMFWNIESVNWCWVTIYIMYFNIKKLLILSSGCIFCMILWRWFYITVQEENVLWK